VKKTNKITKKLILSPYYIISIIMLFSELTTESAPKAVAIAEVKGSKYKGTILYCKQKKEPTESLSQIALPQKAIFKPLYTSHEGYPNRYLISGPSLCGKSYFAAMLAEDYKRQNPRNNIYLMSAVEHDDALDKVKPIRIICNEKIVDDPIQLNELKNSLVIFDDVDAFLNKDISKSLNHLRDTIMTTGRHENIAVISTTHLLLEGDKSKKAITQAFTVILFPSTGGKYHATEFLKRYMGYGKDEIKQIISVPSRWVLINRVPRYILHEKGAFMI